MYCNILIRVISSALHENGRHFVDDIVDGIFLKNMFILINLYLMSVHMSSIYNNLLFLHIIIWCLTCNKPLSEPVMSLFVDPSFANKSWIT